MYIACRYIYLMHYIYRQLDCSPTPHPHSRRLSGGLTYIYIHTCNNGNRNQTMKRPPYIKYTAVLYSLMTTLLHSASLRPALKTICFVHFLTLFAVGNKRHAFFISILQKRCHCYCNMNQVTFAQPLYVFSSTTVHLIREFDQA